MPRAHDWFIVELKEAHLGWGIHRNTSTRPLILGEGYIPIPKNIAQAFSIYNSNMTNNPLPLYNCFSNDGLYSGELLAQGCSQSGDIFAKQFSEHNNLKGLGQWFSQVGARVGDSVLIYFTSPTDVIISHLGNNPVPNPNYGNASANPLF